MAVPACAVSLLPVAAPPSHRANAQDLKHERRRLHLRDLLPKARYMAAFDVTGFMRDHADQLIGRFRQKDRARVYEHIAAIDHEGIEARVVDEMDLDVVARHARRAENRHRVVGDQRFGLGIADQAQLLSQRLRDGHGYRDERRKGNRQPGYDPAGGKLKLQFWRAAKACACV